MRKKSKAESKAQLDLEVDRDDLDLWTDKAYSALWHLLDKKEQTELLDGGYISIPIFVTYAFYPGYKRTWDEPEAGPSIEDVQVFLKDGTEITDYLEGAQYAGIHSEIHNIETGEYP